MFKKILLLVLKATLLVLRIILVGWFKSKQFVTARRARDGKLEKSVIDVRPLQAGKFVVFATYPRPDIDATMLQLLEDFHHAGAQVIVVSNQRIGDETLGALKAFSSCIIIRTNIGQDFGAYQEGYFHLTNSVDRADISKLVFLNDSIYIFSDVDHHHMVDFLLDNEKAWCGVTENFEDSYHVSSFLFSVNNQAVKSAEFDCFWRTYIPYSIRLHAIKRGEFGVSNALLKEGFFPHILYSIYNCQPFIDAIDLGRGEVFELFSIGARDAIHTAVERRHGPTLRASKSEDASASDDTVSTHEKRVQFGFFNYLERKNQSHALALFLVEHLGAPFLKKDLAYREVFLMSEVLRISRNHSEQDGLAISEILRAKGNSASISGFRRILWATGLK